jgi:hypothetical protein
MSDRIDTDALLHKFMKQTDLEKDHQVDLEGDLYRATEKKQREEKDPFQIIGELAGEVRDEVRNHALFHGACVALGTGTLLIEAGASTIVKNLETIGEGDELSDATNRESAVGATLALCASALPDDFGVSLHLKVVGQPGAMRDGASKLLAAIGQSPEFAKIQQGLVDNCRDGQRYLVDRHIGTPAELATALTQNPEFASRYQHDLAFKLGVDSVVWAGAHGELPALMKQLPPAPVAHQLEVRG